MYGKPTLVKLIEYCFDPLKNKVWFAHFLATKRSKYLDQQHKYNAGFNSSGDGYILSGHQQAMDFYHSGPALKLLDPGKTRGSKYLLTGSLVSEKLMPQQFAFSMAHSAMNTISVSKHLEYGNWDKFLNILQKISQKHTLEV
jgi:hypothetical protein